MKLKASLALAFGLLSGMAYSATELVIATVNNVRRSRFFGQSAKLRLTG